MKSFKKLIGERIAQVAIYGIGIVGTLFIVGMWVDLGIIDGLMLLKLMATLFFIFLVGFFLDRKFNIL